MRSGLSNRLYFGIKPLLPQALRMGLRRLRFSSRAREHTGEWPILESAARKPKNWSGWLENKQFAFVITHDVEGPIGLGQCRQLMNLEMELGFRSSFNFIPEGTYSVSKELREELTGNGFEVGVHDLHHDGSLYRSRKNFTLNASRINQYLKEWGAVGFRSGFMLHELEWLHDLNVAYDSSTFDTDPFEPQPDGAGTIFPFWVPRPCTQSIIHRPGPETLPGYVELPYTLAQDSTMFLLLQESTINIWKRKLDWIVGNGGMALVNVHPDYINFSDSWSNKCQFPVSLYVEFLKHLKVQYADRYWNALPKEVATHYLSNRTAFEGSSDAPGLGLPAPLSIGSKNANPTI